MPKTNSTPFDVDGLKVKIRYLVVLDLIYLYKIYFYLADE